MTSYMVTTDREDAYSRTARLSLRPHHCENNFWKKNPKAKRTLLNSKDEHYILKNPQCLSELSINR